MMRAIRLNNRILPRLPLKGAVSHYVVGDGRIEAQGFHPGKAVQFLKGLTYPAAWTWRKQLYTLEVLATHDACRFVTYTPDGFDPRVTQDHVKGLNPSLRVVPGPSFPSLGGRPYVRAARVGLVRNPHFPLETFDDSRGLDAPLTGVIKSMGRPDPGDWFLLQIGWRRRNYPLDWWRLNPRLHWEMPKRPSDPELVEWKRQARPTYLLDIRLLEGHASKATLGRHLIEPVAAAFSSWNRKNGNALRLRGAWSPSTTLSLVHAMYERTEGDDLLTGPRGPHLAEEELAPFLQPSTAGAHLPPMWRAPVPLHSATSHQRSQTASYDALDVTAQPPNDTARDATAAPTLTAQDVDRILARNRPAPAPPPKEEA